MAVESSVFIRSYEADHAQSIASNTRMEHTLKDRSQQFDPATHSPSYVSLNVTSKELILQMGISPDALIVVDQMGSIVMVNEQAAAMFGYSPEELYNQRLEMLLPEDLYDVHTAHRENYFAAPRTRTMGAGLQLFGRHKSGTEFPVDISLRPVLLHDETVVIGAIRDMTEQHRAELERMQQAEQIRLQAKLIELSHDAILIRDSLSRVIFWNKGAEELYGWSSQEALGHITHSLLKTHFPSSRAEVDAYLQEHGSWEGELTHTCRNGGVVIVESRQMLVSNVQGQPTAILEINRNITERRRLEQSMRAVHAQAVANLDFLRQIIDAMPSSIYLVYGPEARLLLANHAAASVWGAHWHVDQPMLEFLATNGIEIFDAQGRVLTSKHFATLRAVREDEMVLHHQEIIRRPNGSSLPVLVNAVPLETTQWRNMVREQAEPLPQYITEESLALVVNQDVSALKEAEYLKDEFIGVAAHELRNPLAVLKGFAEMLIYQTARGKGPQLADWQSEAVEEIDVATSRLDKLTEDLLDVTRLQAGRLSLTRKPTDLVALTQNMMTQRQMTTRQHLLTLNTANSSLVMEIDRARIEQVITNLLSNAIKYSPQGGPIELSLHEEVESHTAFLSIRDHGMGIPVEQQARIFGRFVRAENARTSEITGTGLGLYLSRELVERHGGRLWFESIEGEGSTFFMSLPLPGGS
ncbi:MAG TPA: PAS domain S-box protein [Ktedonobacteraceae bacterium]|nr:PAS domain S-box protein [Ktedonobacteraceae bacterium]